MGYGDDRTEETPDRKPDCLCPGLCEGAGRINDDTKNEIEEYLRCGGVGED